ncbi:unnamed protein product [Nesidiocoris tenuis]|uniref:VWFC domain-containing protein n=1 Tax=Nesidiocoris tenuis TaxID=355587 RepID=A0A6H5G2Y5_9HEMI|nr:unnamed protein product [Nesidiocoris tenuis]
MEAASCATRSPALLPFARTPSLHRRVAAAPLACNQLHCPVLMTLNAFQEENSCQVGNVTFSLGDVWEVKKCERCTCGSGRIITCTQTVCESGCSNSNPCCPNCSDGYGHDSDAHSGMKIPGWLYLVITAVLFALGLCTVNLIKNWDRFGIDSDPCNGNYKVVATCDNPPPSSKGPV